MSKKNQTGTAIAEAPEQTTSDAPTTEQAPKAPKVKTPEQQAAQLRREAGELRRSAAHLEGDAKASLEQLAANKDVDADALAPRKSGKSTEPRPTCTGTKKDGTACTAKAMEGSEFCTDHRPVRARFTDAEWAAFQAIPTETIIERLGWGVALKLAKEQVAKQ